MKKIVVILSLLLLIGFADRIESTVELKTTDWFHQPVICLDSTTGVPVTADSAHIHVFYGNADSSCYSARITTIPSSWIDRVVYAGATTPSFFFMDQVADIDADSGTGYYTVNVVLWKDRTPTDNIFSFNLVDTTTQSYGSINYWKADSVAGAVTATNKANFKITDTEVWDKDISGYSGTKAGAYVKVLFDKKPANLFLSDDVWTDAKAGYLDVAISSRSTFNPSSDSTFPDISHLWDLGVILVGADRDTLFKIRDYAHAVQGTIIVHAPHGDNWATAGAGDTTEMKAMMQNNWDPDTDGLLSVEAGVGGADTSDIKSMIQGNWDPDTDGKFAVEESLIVDKSDLWGLGVEVNTKTDFKLAQDGLDPDTSFTNLQTVAQGIKSKTDNLPTDPADQSLIMAGIDGLDDNPWDNAKSDTTSGMGDWFADWFNADWWLTANVWDEDTSAHNVAGSYGVLLKDTSAYQGEAAGLTKEEIITEFEDRGYGFGSGILACTVYAKLDTDSSALSGIHIVARNTDEDELLGHCYTNANGWCALVLDSIAGGAYHKFWLIDVDYSFTFPESADVNIDTSLTFYGSAFDYGDPPAENQCAVYGQIFDSQLDSLNGAVIKARVYVPPDSVLRYEDHVISPFIVSDTTTVTGRWRLDLTPNSLYTPTDTWYIFTIEKPGPWGGTIIDEDTLTVPELESYKY